MASIKININSIFLNKILIILLFLHAFISATIFEYFQIFIEIFIILGFISIFVFYNIKLKPVEFFLISVFFLVSLVSFFINPLFIFILNFKVYILAIFSFIFFSKFKLKSHFINFFFFINVFFVLYQYLFGSMPLSFLLNPIVGAFGQYTDSRPLGFFLNTHYSAFFLATILIYWSKKYKFYIFDFLLIYFTMSKFTFVSYLSHKIGRNNLLVNFFKNKILVFISLFCFLGLAFYFSDFLIILDLGSGLSSYNTIIEQLLTVDSYKYSFSFFPNDSVKIIEEFTNDAGNEIMYFTLLFQGGVLLFLVFLFYINSLLKIYKIFIYISLLHYGFIMSPLIIFLICHFNEKLSLEGKNI